jgi:hypothetical protein
VVVGKAERKHKVALPSAGGEIIHTLRLSSDEMMGGNVVLRSC